MKYVSDIQIQLHCKLKLRIIIPRLYQFSLILDVLCRVYYDVRVLFTQ